MLKKLFKTGVTAAAGWVGTKLGGPTGGAFAKKITGSLFDRQGGGGDFQLQDTSVAAQNYGGRVGFDKSDRAGGTSNIKTANAKELNDEWDYRLTKWFRNKDQMFT
jgi:hypothetical protein